MVIKEIEVLLDLSVQKVQQVVKVHFRLNILYYLTNHSIQVNGVLRVW